MTTISIVLLLLTLCSLSRAIIHSKNHACDPSESSWSPYSGYRIQHSFSTTRLQDGIEGWSQASLKSSSSYHQMVVTRCSRGRVLYEISLPIDRSIDIAWNTTVCSERRDSNEGLLPCIHLARRKLYALRNLSLYFPGTLVGVLYECQPDTCHDTSQFLPILPLLADKIVFSWTRISNFNMQYRVPMLYTPDILHRRFPKITESPSSWASNVNVFELYDYSIDTRGALTKAADESIDLLKDLVMQVHSELVDDSNLLLLAITQQLPGFTKLLENYFLKVQSTFNKFRGVEGQREQRQQG